MMTKKGGRPLPKAPSVRIAAVLLVGSLLGLVACSKQDAQATNAGAGAPSATQGGASGPMSAAEAVRRFQQQKKSFMGKPIEVKGHFSSFTESGGTLNVTVNQSPKGDMIVGIKASPLCAMTVNEQNKARLRALKEGDAIVAKGTVTGDFFDAPLISECVLE